jgi:hypothetical protein
MKQRSHTTCPISRFDMDVAVPVFTSAVFPNWRSGLYRLSRGVVGLAGSLGTFGID